jgi:hypothetical protein
MNVFAHARRGMPPFRRRAACLLMILAAASGRALAGSIEGPRGEAGEAPVEPLKKPPLDSIRAPKVHSVPYPNGAIYLSRGITGTFLGGRRKLVEETQYSFQWQGELSYFYTPSFSGGIGFRIIAGEPNSDKQKIVNRYFAHLRYHKAWEKVALYAGPQIGLGNFNVKLDSLAARHGLDSLEETRPTLALDFGGGWKFSRPFGLTLGTNLEYSMVDEDRPGVNNSMNMHLYPGLSWDILSLAGSLRALVPAFYVHGESQIGFLLSQETGPRSDIAYMLGLGLAF